MNPGGSAIDIARAFLVEMQACVRAVDYGRAQPLFGEDVVAFGTYAAVVSGRERLQQQQWRNIWVALRDFTFPLEKLPCLGTDQRRRVIVPWGSVRRRDGGGTFARRGRG